MKRMKRTTLALALILNSQLLILNSQAAVPLSWTVETTRATPAVFEAYQGETIEFEARLQNAGKPLAAPAECSFYWQTNGMGSAYWSAPASATSNLLSATWSPSMDVGARVYNCFIGSPSNNYHAAFQLRLRPSPGATPNALPLPTPVIDFARVTVLNPPWPTNAVPTVDGSARALPKYLHELDFDDSYAADAERYYEIADATGGCSARATMAGMERNFDFPYDDRAEFVIRMRGNDFGRLASVGVANVGTNITEQMVTSGKQLPPQFYKALPGATVDGINECGVVAEINVVPVNGAAWETKGSRDINAIGAVRWALNYAPTAEHAATNLAKRVYIPASMKRKGYSCHFMIADANSAWIVEDGVAHRAWSVTNCVVMTNFRLYADDPYGTGRERYAILEQPHNSITSAWFRAAYRRPFARPSEFAAPGVGRWDETGKLLAWAEANVPRGAPETLRRGGGSWQTLHTSVYDFARKTLKICVQESADFYTFAVPSTGGVKPEAVREIVQPMIDASTNKLNDSISGIDAKATAAQTAANAAQSAANAAQATADSAAAKANSALVYSSATYQYMAGNTNAWFEGTNYPDRVTAANKVKFAFEPGMDLLSMPCSMALKEIRDSEKQDVWDQRDWTVWYWNFKSSQMSNHFNHVVHALAAEVRTNCMTRGWAKYTAVQGLDNPAADTLWIDTPKVTLAAGHQWEKLVEVGGAGYWTLTGNGVELAPEEAESSFLTVKDFEGNACLTFRKTSSYLVYCEVGTDISRSFYDAQGRVVFHLTTSAQPTAEFSIFCNGDDFVEQGAEGCPANYEWTGSAGNWDCHFKLKDGIDSNTCFARFKILVEGENVVEHTIPIKISGGIVFEQDGRTYKIKPTISGNTVNWSVVQ